MLGMQQMLEDVRAHDHRTREHGWRHGKRVGLLQVAGQPGSSRIFLLAVPQVGPDVDPDRLEVVAERHQLSGLAAADIDDIRRVHPAGSQRSHLVDLRLVDRLVEVVDEVCGLCPTLVTRLQEVGVCVSVTGPTVPDARQESGVGGVDYYALIVQEVPPAWSHPNDPSISSSRRATSWWHSGLQCESAGGWGILPARTASRSTPVRSRHASSSVRQNCANRSGSGDSVQSLSSLPGEKPMKSRYTRNLMGT